MSKYIYIYIYTYPYTCVYIYICIYTYVYNNISHAAWSAASMHACTLRLYDYAAMVTRYTI